MEGRSEPRKADEGATEAERADLNKADERRKGADVAEVCGAGVY